MSNLQKISTFDNIKDRFVQLVDETTFLKEASFAVQAFNKNKYLNKSTDASKLLAVMNVAQTGLSLNPVLKYAYLVPRWNATISQVECHLEPGYQGLVKLVTDTGSAKTIYCYPVYEGDEFEEILGTSVEIIHKPKRKTTILEKVYAVAILHDGTKQVEVMTSEQINNIRDKSESYKAFKSGKSKTAIWETDYDEMSRKTVLRRIVKYLPKTERYERLAKAIDLDNFDYKITPGQEELIYTLIRTSALSEDQKLVIESDIDIMTAERAGEVLQYLKDNQLDAISAGNPYSAKDIQNKLANEQ